jgi:phage I-like protein
MADKDDFLQEETQTEEVEKIKIGEKEYSQEDLNKLVGLGEKAVELEDKWNTKIDKLYPEYTKKTQELSEYKRRDEEAIKAKETKVQKKASEGAELSPEEQTKLVKQELGKYGVVTEDKIYQFIANFEAAKELNQNVGNILDEAKESGKPKTTREELLAYMDENGIKNPTSAYKLMFEDELKEWEKKQVDTLRKPGLETESSSGAGSKAPLPVKITKANIGELLKQAMSEE